MPKNNNPKGDVSRRRSNSEDAEIAALLDGIRLDNFIPINDENRRPTPQLETARLSGKKRKRGIDGIT